LNSQTLISVPVFEKENEIGGKSSSITVDGHAFDLGGHLCNPSYTGFSQLVKELELETEPLSIIYHLNLAANSITPGADCFDFNRFEDVMMSIRTFDTIGYKAIGFRHLSRFSNLTQSVVNWNNSGTDAQREFLKMLKVAYTSSGYGFLDDPNLPVAFVTKFAAHMEEKSLLWTVKGGMGQVTRKMSKNLSDVRCGIDIKRIVRSGLRSSISVSYTTSTSENLVDETFDELVIATPLSVRETLSYLDLDIAERSVLQEILHYNYYTFVVRLEGDDLPRNGWYVVTDYCNDMESGLDHLVAFHHRYEDSNVYIAYMYARSTSTESVLLENLKTDFLRFKGTVTEVIRVCQWPFYCPHPSPASMANGWYSRAEGLQGRRHTLWVGSVFNFEFLENNLQYAQDLVNRFFPLPKTDTERNESSSTALSGDPVSRKEYWVEVITKAVTGVISKSKIDRNSSFTSLGLDSIRSMTMLGSINSSSGVTVEPSWLAIYPTVESLAEHLAISSISNDSISDNEEGDSVLSGEEAIDTQNRSSSTQATPRDTKHLVCVNQIFSSHLEN